MFVVPSQSWSQDFSCSRQVLCVRFLCLSPFVQFTLWWPNASVLGLKGWFSEFCFLCLRLGLACTCLKMPARYQEVVWCTRCNALHHPRSPEIPEHRLGKVIAPIALTTQHIAIIQCSHFYETKAAWQIIHFSWVVYTKLKMSWAGASSLWQSLCTVAPRGGETLGTRVRTRTDSRLPMCELCLVRLWFGLVTTWLLCWNLFPASH